MLQLYSYVLTLTSWVNVRICYTDVQPKLMRLFAVLLCSRSGFVGSSWSSSCSSSTSPWGSCSSRCWRSDGAVRRPPIDPPALQFVDIFFLLLPSYLSPPRFLVSFIERERSLRERVENFGGVWGVEIQNSYHAIVHISLLFLERHP